VEASKKMGLLSVRGAPCHHPGLGQRSTEAPRGENQDEGWQAATRKAQDKGVTPSSCVTTRLASMAPMEHLAETWRVLLNKLLDASSMETHQEDCHSPAGGGRAAPWEQRVFSATVCRLAVGPAPGR